MSASTKKKLRKEQQAAAMTERQRMEKKEAKKLKRNTVLFIAVISLVLLAFVGILLYQWVTTSGIFEKNTDAASVNGTKINSVEMNYYFVDTAMEQASQFMSYAEYFGGDISVMGLDPSKPLDKQEYEEGVTWADYLMDQAMAKAQHDYALAKEAKAKGYKLSKEDQDTLNLYSTNLDTNALIMGYEDADALLRQQYGNGATKKTYLAYLKRGMIANGYYTQYSDSLEFDATAIADRDAKNPSHYNSYDYSYYYVSYANYLEGGTKNEEGTVEYSPEEEAAARAKAKEIADQLALCTNLEELDAAVKELEVKGKKDQKLTAVTNTLYSKVTGAHQEWVSDDARQEGDMTVLENKGTAEEGQEAPINGYYVMVFQGSTTNDEQPMTSVRHLLIKFPEAEGEEEDEHEGHDHEHETEPTEDATEPTENETTEPTESVETTEPIEDAESAETTETTQTEGGDTTDDAKATAEDLLAQWEAGDKTEESFIELVKKHSEDTSAETGGLFENIHAGSSYVENFLNWAIDPARQAGDVEIVETEYGYHIMYFVKWEEQTYRQQLIETELHNESLESWYNGIIEAKPAKKLNTKYVRFDLKLSEFGY